MLGWYVCVGVWEEVQRPLNVCPTTCSYWVVHDREIQRWTQARTEIRIDSLAIQDNEGSDRGNPDFRGMHFLGPTKPIEW
jgi:hypothetical protein